MRRALVLPVVSALGAMLLVAGCGDGKQADPAASAPPPAVTVVRVSTAEIRPATTFTGRIEGKEKVDLRARVEGFLEKRLFTEGADVKERRAAVRDREGALSGRGRSGEGSHR